ncbi:hypothetical protein A2973_04615 [Candidatus Gottesmanbacteria bacterium RIFCSPLOWO2_01_FULL_49_10]|uniref:Uncharacterized protein n=1 Tax=Candidatus Gottesmanbacteria bacterium RIFCSPLOWO2_01_FULL_49_10 TaxID=1798396 RepID=A0A1F6B0R5_9BACT|nr:MAG: hypothetical protein A2973_04615 [Candidatus Gottesmanbacteria bacterium RIFCSPLOWO2_01_FULL_49_10]
MFKEGSIFPSASRAILAAAVGLSACAPRFTPSGGSPDGSTCRDRWSPAQLFLHPEGIVDQYNQPEGVVVSAENPETGRWGLLVLYPGGGEFIRVPLDDPDQVTWAYDDENNAVTVTLFIYQNVRTNPRTGSRDGNGIFCLAAMRKEQDLPPDPFENWWPMDLYPPAIAWDSNIWHPDVIRYDVDVSPAQVSRLPLTSTPDS